MRGEGRREGVRCVRGEGRREGVRCVRGEGRREGVRCVRGFDEEGGEGRSSEVCEGVRGGRRVSGGGKE